MKRYLLLIIAAFFFSSCSEVVNEPPKKDTNTSIVEPRKSPPIEIYGPVPTKSQMEWQDAELVLFIHFGINTFTGNEWGDGKEDPAIFNPTLLNAQQWVDVAKEYGFTYVILTAKHHDGFCLWPSKYTSHSILNSPYKNGKGDIVKEFADACHNSGIKFSFYLSPWDRHEATYGTEQYNTYYQNQLTELLTHYGEVSEVWFDGANGEGPNGIRQDYNWNLYFNTIKHYQPDALISNVGPDIRWIGNETGLGNETEWCVQPKQMFLHHSALGDVWYPSECDVSIRPGWFYHKSEDTQIKSIKELVDIYFKTVGRNSNLLINIPPNKEGLISNYDINRLKEWKQTLNSIFADDLFYQKNIVCSNIRNNSEDFAGSNCLDNNRYTFWTTDRSVTSAQLEITLPQKKDINIIRLEEAIEYGQRVKSFEVYCDNMGTMEKVFEGTTIGRSRIITFNKVNTDKVRIIIKDSDGAPTLRILKGFYSNLI